MMYLGPADPFLFSVLLCSDPWLATGLLGQYEMMISVINNLL